MIVFLVSGIWHGANWTFIVWGLIHGLGQVVCRLGGIKETKNKITNAVLWLMTFIFVNLTWVIFRADGLSDAVKFFGQIFNYTGLHIDETIVGAFQFREFELVLRFVPIIGESLLNGLTLLAFTGCMAGILIFKNTKQKVELFKEPKWYNSISTALLLVWSVVSFTGVSTFLYWNF